MGQVLELFWNVQWWGKVHEMARAPCYVPSEFRLHIRASSLQHHTQIPPPCSGLGNVPPKIHIYPEPQNMTLFENRVFAGIIS